MDFTFDRLVILVAAAAASAAVILAPCARFWCRRWRRALAAALYYRDEAHTAHRLYLEQLGRSAVFAAENELLRAVVKDAALPASARELLARGVN